jgi:ATP-dependent Lhr-like helicase
MTRDELAECAALLGAVRAGRLDAIVFPVAPLDILAQQVVAECAARNWQQGELFELFRRAAPYANLSREDYDAVVKLAAEGVETGRGRRAAYLHRDATLGQLRGRRAWHGPPPWRCWRRGSTPRISSSSPSRATP